MKTIPINEDLAIVYKDGDISFVNFARNKQLVVKNKELIEFLTELKDYPHDNLVKLNEVLIIKLLNIVERINNNEKDE